MRERRRGPSFLPRPDFPLLADRDVYLRLAAMSSVVVSVLELVVAAWARRKKVARYVIEFERHEG